MGVIPSALSQALEPITIVCGHYGAGKTNFSVNLALDCAASGRHVNLIDLDLVNPYFRATEQRRLLEHGGVEVIAPVFAEAGTSLDVPSITGRIEPAIESSDADTITIIDVGGDDVGATALGRYARLISSRRYAMLYVANAFRNLVQEIPDAVENLREIEIASRLRATAIVDNAHLKADTDTDTLRNGFDYAIELSEAVELPIACVTEPARLADSFESSIENVVQPGLLYPIQMLVKNPWE